MKKLTVALITALAITATAQTTRTVTKPVPRKTTAAEITAYKARAAWATEVVINSADKLKEFKSTTTYDEIWYSTPSLQLYRDQLTSHAELIRTVQSDLLGTATELLIIGQDEAAAAERGMKYKGAGY